MHGVKHNYEVRATITYTGLVQLHDFVLRTHSTCLFHSEAWNKHMCFDARVGDRFYMYVIARIPSLHETMCMHACVSLQLLNDALYGETYPEMSGQKSEVINSRFANQRISSRRHVWEGWGGGGFFNTKQASQHLP